MRSRPRAQPRLQALHRRDRRVRRLPCLERRQGRVVLLPRRPRRSQLGRRDLQRQRRGWAHHPPRPPCARHLPPLRERVLRRDGLQSGLPQHRFQAARRSPPFQHHPFHLRHPVERRRHHHRPRRVQQRGSQMPRSPPASERSKRSFDSSKNRAPQARPRRTIPESRSWSGDLKAPSIRSSRCANVSRKR